jgi:hypothetical protein
MADNLKKNKIEDGINKKIQKIKHALKILLKN